MKFWSKWNRTEGGYEWLDISQIVTCSAIVVFVVAIVLGVMWTK